MNSINDNFQKWLDGFSSNTNLDGGVWNTYQSIKKIEIEKKKKNKTIKISFKNFMNDDYEEGDRNLYIVWAGKQCLYVGISRNCIYNRWFGNLSPHMYKSNHDYNSPIGRAVAVNSPKSMNWIVEMRYVSEENLNFEEIKLIRKFRPLFNRMHAVKKTEKEMRLYMKFSKDNLVITNSRAREGSL